MRKSKRKLVRGISFLTAFILAVTTWGIVNSVKFKKTQRDVLQSNERALTELGASLDDVSVNLQKCVYASGSETLGNASIKLWRSGARAKESLSEITDGNTQVTDIYKFLSQVGEYTLSINKKLINGEPIEEKERENLTKLLEYSKSLSEKINMLIEQEENGVMDFREVKSTLQRAGDSRINLQGQLTDANQSMVDYPTLIYDGPFSDHIDSKKSQFIEKMKLVTESEARERAAEFLGLREEQLELLSKAQNNMSTYTFYNGAYTISVTQKGGIVNYMLTSQYASEITLTTEQALKIAREYLSEKGYENVKVSYFSTQDGICTFNFSYYLDGVTYYTDLIKISVALDDGDVTAFDCTGYLMNHKKRTIPKNVKYNLTEGKELLRDDLQVISYKKAFIPTESLNEIYCYEYHCRARDGQEVLIYIDPVTGSEKNILLLLYSDGGVLTK